MFGEMWPHESADATGSGTRWPNVANAMAEAGWSMEPGGGSEVCFVREPDNEDEKRTRILFHTRHDGMATSAFLRKMGYRLKERKGWRWKMFGEKPRNYVGVVGPALRPGDS